MPDYSAGGGGNLGQGGEFYKQSGFFINNKVQYLYEVCSRLISSAFQQHYKGIQGMRNENAMRIAAFSAFQNLISLTIDLGSIEDILMGFPEEERGFKTVNDLCLGLAEADNKLITMEKVYLKWWRTYSMTLNKAGLIKIYTIEDMNSEYKSFRK